MPRSSAQDQQHDAAEPLTTTSLESALGVKSALRVRNHGAVKNAHVVLRKVDEEEYEAANGSRRTRAVFSLFAHKPINVRAGKELFLYLQAADGELVERSVAFEADVRTEGVEDVSPCNCTRKGDEETKPMGVATALEQALPPKMRKVWGRKSMSSVVNAVHSGKSLSFWCLHSFLCTVPIY